MREASGPTFLGREVFDTYRTTQVRRRTGRCLPRRRADNPHLEGASASPANPETHSRAGTARYAPPSWSTCAPLLSPALATKHRDAFIVDDSSETTVALHALTTLVRIAGACLRCLWHGAADLVSDGQLRGFSLVCRSPSAQHQAGDLSVSALRQASPGAHRAATRRARRRPRAPASRAPSCVMRARRAGRLPLRDEVEPRRSGWAARLVRRGRQ